MPQAGGSYVYLREAYGAERWGRLLSFLYIWQTLFQGPLSIASGRTRIRQLLHLFLQPSATRANGPRASARTSPNPSRQPSCSIVVALLYRRITEIGKISIAFSAIVIATILWIIFGGVTHFDATSRLRFFRTCAGIRPGCCSPRSGHGTVQTVYSYLGYYNVCNLGGEMKNPEKNIPRAIFISIVGITVLYLAMQTSILAVIPWREAADAKAIASTFIERVYGSPVGRRRHRPDPDHRPRQRLRRHARLFARALCRRR